MDPQDRAYACHGIGSTLLVLEAAGPVVQLRTGKLAYGLGPDATAGKLRQMLKAFRPEGFLT